MMTQWSEILLSAHLVIGFEISFVLPASLATASAPVLRNLAHRRDTGELRLTRRLWQGLSARDFSLATSNGCEKSTPSGDTSSLNNSMICSAIISRCRFQRPDLMSSPG